MVGVDVAGGDGDKFTVDGGQVLVSAGVVEDDGTLVVGGTIELDGIVVDGDSCADVLGTFVVGAGVSKGCVICVVIAELVFGEALEEVDKLLVA